VLEHNGSFEQHVFAADNELAGLDACDALV